VQSPNLWTRGQLMAFSGLDGPTDFANGLVLRTADDYAVEVKIPGSATIRYQGPTPPKVELTGDFAILTAPGKISRLVLADTHNLVLEGGFVVTEHDDKLTTAVQGSRTVLAPTGKLNNALLTADLESILQQRARLLNSVTLPGRLPDDLRDACIKALSQLKTQIYTPEGMIRSTWSTPDRWPHKNMWLWDSVFHAIGIRRLDIKLARSLVEAVFDVQSEDGYIPHMATPTTRSSITQPPVLGLAIKQLEEVESDPIWRNRLIPKLGRYLEWIMANRDTDGSGLVEWFISPATHCRCDESGMDNSPRFDGAIQLDATDFNAYLAHECEVMAQFQPERRDFWQNHYQRLCQLINERLWSEELGIYVDYDIVSKRQTGVMASAGLLPLLCGAPTPAQARRLRDHLHNPATFGTPFRVPSIAAENTAAYSKDMWRGPVWININYMIIHGLKRYGFLEDAEKLARDTVAEELKFCRRYGTFFEFYDDRSEDDPPALLRKPQVALGNPVFGQPFRDYGWSAALFLELVLSDRKYAPEA